MQKQLIITYSLTGSSKELLSLYPDADIAELTTAIEIPKSMFKAGYVVTFKNIGADYKKRPDYDQYEEIIVIIPVWMGKPARVFTDVYQKYPFKEKKVVVYLTSLGFEEKPVRRLTKLLEVNNEVTAKYIYGGKSANKKVVPIK